MRYLTLLLFLIMFELHGQTPQGRLFLHLSGSGASQPYTLRYLDFSTSSLVTVDSGYVTDMIRINNMLYIANNTVYGYNLNSLQLTDSLQNLGASKLEQWNNYMIVTSTTAPHFRVFDINNNYSPVFSLNTNKVPVLPNDICTDSSFAYLVYDTTLQIINMVQQDTLITLQTPHPFAWAGMNFFVLPTINGVYIDVEYATGAPRFSLLKLDQQNMQVDSVFHWEFDHNSIKPVVANDVIYLAHFLSYYNTTTDSLVQAVYNQAFIVEHDPATNLIFKYDPMNNTLSSYINGTYPQTFSIPSFINHALFVPNISTQVKEQDYNTVNIFPNPCSNKLNVEIASNQSIHLKLFDVTGKCILYREGYHNNGVILLRMNDIRGGLYFLEITSGAKKYVKKVFKRSL